MLHVQKKVFANELPLYYLKSQKAPVITLQVWVRTGSADELKNEAGLSHFIEHLVFKGTKSFKAGEIARKIEEVGGSLNAYTSFDQTVFYITVPNQHFDIAAQALYEMVSSPLFDEEEVNNEREVVVEEINMGKDQPSRVSSRLLFETLFKGHPYELPVIGTEENIRRVSLQEIKEYFYERYISENMSVLCVGDFKEENLKEIENKFSKIKNRSENGRDRKRSSRKLSGEKLNIKESSFERGQTYIAWPVEGFKGQEADAYELLSLILGQGESSFLYKDLKLKKDVCRSVGSFYFGSENEGVFVVSLSTLEEEITKAIKELPKTMKAFMEQTDINYEIKKSLNLFESENAYKEESLSAQSRGIGEDWLYFGEYGESEKRKERIKKIKAEDLAKTLNQILEKPVYICSLLKDSKSVDFKTLQKELGNLVKEKIGFKNTGWKPVSAQKAAAPAHSFTEESWETEKGNRVTYISPGVGEVVSIKLGFGGGDLLTDRNQEGLTQIFGRVWGRELGKFNEEKMNSLLDFHSSSFSAFSGKHSSGLSLTSLRQHLKDLSPLFKSSLSEAFFNESVLEREKSALIKKINSIKDSPPSVAFKRFSQEIFKDSIYEKDPLGKVEYIKSIKKQDLHSLLDKTLQEAFSLSVVGNVSKEYVNDLVQDIESVLTEKNKTVFSKIEPIRNFQEHQVFLESDKAQTHLILGYPGLGYGSDKKIHLEMISALLGGQGGRLFIELRDKKSLAYSVSPIEYFGLFGGYFGAYIACDPSKRELATRMIREEFKKVVTQKITQEELEWMKNQLLGRHAMSSQKNSYLAGTTLFDSLYLGDPFKYKNLKTELNKIKVEELQETFSKVLEGPETLVCLG